jgi:hypothetical protein
MVLQMIEQEKAAAAMQTEEQEEATICGVSTNSF